MDADDFDQDWSQKMKRAAVQAAEGAEKYARDSAQAAQNLGRSQAIRHVFCRFHAENRCSQGLNCEFSHDSSVIGRVPLANKTELECVFFAKGQCTREASCPFAHGPEELNELLLLRQSAQGGRG